MSDKGGQENLKISKLDLLKQWEHIEEVYQMILDGQSTNSVAKFINHNGFTISTPMVYRFVDEYKKGIQSKVQAKQLKKVDNKIKKAKGGTPKKVEPIPEPTVERQTVTKYYNDIEVLDSIINLGMETLSQMDALSPSVAISAIKLKSELTDSTMSAYGLEEIRIREQAREQALLACVQKYVPADRWDELLDDLERETEKFYESIGMGESYRQAKQMEE